MPFYEGVEVTAFCHPIGTLESTKSIAGPKRTLNKSRHDVGCILSSAAGAIRIQGGQGSVCRWLRLASIPRPIIVILFAKLKSLLERMAGTQGHPLTGFVGIRKTFRLGSQSHQMASASKEGLPAARSLALARDRLLRRRCLLPFLKMKNRSVSQFLTSQMPSSCSLTPAGPAARGPDAIIRDFSQDSSRTVARQVGPARSTKASGSGAGASSTRMTWIECRRRAHTRRGNPCRYLDADGGRRTPSSAILAAMLLTPTPPAAISKRKSLTTSSSHASKPRTRRSYLQR